MSRSHDPLSLDIVFFFLFVIFTISFVANMIKKVWEIAGRSVVNKTSGEKARPSPAEQRAGRIEKERAELRFGFPMPRPGRTWVKPQPVIETYVREKTASAGQAAGAAIEQAPLLAPQMPAPETPKEETRLDQLLRDQDPVMQGILMSIVLRPPRALRDRPYPRPL